MACFPGAALYPRDPKCLGNPPVGVRRLGQSNGRQQWTQQGLRRPRRRAAAEPEDASMLRKRRELEKALEAAEKAIKAVELNIENLERLPSAKTTDAVPSVTARYAQEVGLPALRYLVGAVLGLAVLAASQAFGLALQLLAASAAGAGLGAYGFRKNSLSKSGGIAAAVVGTVMLACGLRPGGTLLAFYFSSSALTRMGEDLKNVEEGFKAGGSRDWKQVLSNAFVPTVLAAVGASLIGFRDAPLGPSVPRQYSCTAGALLGYLACCTGDTWASEVGQLSGETPRLITTGRKVRKGTNGAATQLGLLASIGGGLFLGACFYVLGLLSPTLWMTPGQFALAEKQWLFIPLGAMAGLLGSVTDSVLGASLQYTGYNRKTGKVTSRMGPEVTDITGIPLLDNNAVNIVSASLTSLVTGIFTAALFH